MYDVHAINNLSLIAETNDKLFTMPEYLYITKAIILVQVLNMTIRKLANGRESKFVETPPELDRCMMCML